MDALETAEERRDEYDAREERLALEDERRDAADACDDADADARDDSLSGSGINSSWLSEVVLRDRRSSSSELPYSVPSSE